MPRFASPAPASFSIGELSRRTSVNIETIRYYERIQLLPPPPRTAGGRRVYGPDESQVLTFIRRARELGFTLGEIRTLLALSAGDHRQTCREAREIAARLLAEIRTKIADLRAMERVLGETVALCDTGRMSGCQVIETLSAE
jgi:MerR family transcriptional regulator, mercuric resistance operon regulatory protein